MNGFTAFLGRSLRGMRLLEFGALMVLLAMVLGVYLAKAQAGRERNEITAVQAQIGEEQRKLRLLQAEVAHLEEPERMERLAEMAGLGPTNAKHEGAPEELSRIAQEALMPEKKAKGEAPSRFEGHPAPPAPAAAAQGPQTGATR